MVPSGGRRNPPGTSDTGATPDGRKKQVDLAEIVRRWGTPTAHERTHSPRDVASGIQLANQAAKWATPAALDWKSDDPAQSPEHSPPLGRQVLMTHAAGASGSSEEDLLRLNPLFVAALMKLPAWWTRFGV